MLKPTEPQRANRKADSRGSQASPSTKAERIAAQLRERIIDGSILAGEHLQQAALARRMCVSSIPLREAIRMLEAEGFVEVVPFKGARVKRLSAEEITERVKIAIALETCAVELTLPTLTEEDFDRVGELADRLYPASDITSWHAQMAQLLGILFGMERWPVLFDLILGNRQAARRYTEILVRRTIEDPKWANEWAAGYFPRLIGLMRTRDLEAVKDLQRSRLEEYLAMLLPGLAADADRGERRRRTLDSLKGPKPSKGRK